MESDLTTALDTNVALLGQGVEAVDRLGQDAYGYVRPGHSSIGAHVRHVLDHYQCFLTGLETGHIDYDAREREPETELVAARAITRLHATAASLARLDPADGGRQVRVNAASGAHGERPAAWTPSTVTRELGFLLSHTVHHYALIRLLAEWQDVMLDDAFGVAPATLAHRRQPD